MGQTCGVVPGHFAGNLPDIYIGTPRFILVLFFLVSCEDSSLSVSLTTCICFGGEVLYRGLYRVRKPELPHRSVASLCGKNYACNRRQECAIRKPTQRVQHAARSTQQGVLSQSSAGDKGPPLQAFTTFGFGASGGDLRGAATFCMGRTP